MQVPRAARDDKSVVGNRQIKRAIAVQVSDRQTAGARADIRPYRWREGTVAIKIGRTHAMGISR